MQLRPEIMGEAFGEEAMPAPWHRLREDKDNVARLKQRAQLRLRAQQTAFYRPGVFVIFDASSQQRVQIDHADTPRAELQSVAVEAGRPGECRRGYLNSTLSTL